MADKSTQLILDALTRAAAEPAGLALYANKAEPGLFPATSAARAAADRAKADGLLRVVSDPKGRAAREVCTLTDKGMHFLVRQASPRQVLEDFVRVLEERQAAVAHMAASLTTMRAAVEQVLPRLAEHPVTNGKPPAPGGLARDVKARLADWQATAGAAHDCPLPDLYRRVGAGVTVGQFHDALRELHAAQQVYLHPWTGPLYALPEPALALLVGHEVAYYASAR